MSVQNVAYNVDGTQAAKFWLSKARVRGIRGPIGSGKSVLAAQQVMDLCRNQKPDENGVRWSRWAVVRNTAPELRTTTVKTWREWFGDEFGRFKWNSPFTHEIYFAMPDKTVVSAEIWFIALDRPKDVKKLLSMELSGAWVNEAREADKTIIDAIDSRLGRYPSQNMVKGGCTRPCLLMDTNSMPADHWWPIMSGEVPPPEYLTEAEREALIKPKSWEFFAQAPAMIEMRDERNQFAGWRINPERENRRGLPDSYYVEQVPGKSRSFIAVYMENKYQSVFDGRLVYPTFNKNAHVARAPIETTSADIIVGIDFGRTPTAVCIQQRSGGGWNVLMEVYGQGMGAKRFAEFLKREIGKKGWTERNFRWYGDPAGDEMSQADETSAFMMLRAAGIPVIPAPGNNDPTVRIEAVEQVLDRLVEGRPALAIDPGCISLIHGFEGGYHYQLIGMANGQQSYDSKPDKNRFSHFHDALQYAVLGGGEGRRALSGKTAPGRAMVAQRGGSPLSRLRGMKRGFGRPAAR